MKLYEPISIALGLLLLCYVAADKWTSWQDRKEIKQSIEKNFEQSVTINTLAGNIMQASQKEKELIKEKQEVERKYEEKLVEKDKQVGSMFGTVASQADTIYQSTPNGQTQFHLDTSLRFMKLFSGNLTDVGMAWNNAYVRAQNSEMELLKQHLNDLKTQNNNLTSTLTQEIEMTGNLTQRLNKKTEEHVQEALKVKIIEGEKAKTSSIFEKFKQTVYFAVIISALGGLIYLGFHIYQIVSYKKKLNEEITRRREANEKYYETERVKNETITSIKTFLHSGPEGNSQMLNILKANGLKKIFEDTINQVEPPPENKA